MHGVHDLNHRQAAFGFERGAPKLFKFGLLGRVADGLIVGIEHRDQAGVRCALHIVLPAQRMQAGARPANLAAHQGEGDQAARIVGAVDALGNAHSPKDDRPVGGGISAGHGADNLRVDAADFGHLFRREILDRAFEFFISLGIALDVLLVCQAFLYNRVDKPI